MSSTFPPSSPESSTEASEFPVDRDAAVRSRYSDGASRQVPELCCPVEYDTQYLTAIPEAVLDRDYGCGDPSRHVRKGETVLDLGSGAGKICFIASQIVGPEGRVLGVDMNDDMLGLARESAPLVAERIGHDNVTFVKARIEDLGLDRAALDVWLAENPVRSDAELSLLEAHIELQRSSAPLIADDSVDVVLSNCVLNLVLPERKGQLFEEIFRVIKPGGRAVISDIVSDEDIPQHLADDNELWSGCISGAWREDLFCKAFEDAGFQGITILERAAEPWQTVEGIEFRSVTIEATVGESGPCYEQNQAVIYKGPWKSVQDDDGHTLHRGQPMAVCGRTYRFMTSGPHKEHVIGIEPREPVAETDAQLFACTGDRVRAAGEIKGSDFKVTSAAPSDCCEPGECC
ncbi:MAG: arsenite methyltransferase [Pseudohongiellaceae bacterium]|jgi:arsenite methyltransferase